MLTPRCPECGGFIHHSFVDTKGHHIYACTRCRIGQAGHDQRYFRLQPMVEVRIKSESRGEWSTEPMIPESKGPLKAA